MNRLGVQRACAMLLLLLVSLPAAGQTTQPTADANQVDQATEAQPLRISESDSRAVTTKSAVTGGTVSNYSDLSRIAVALLIVIGIILLLRSAAQRSPAYCLRGVQTQM